MEFSIWLGVLVIGSWLILTSDSPTDIILASLAITFVNDIDNNLYDTCIDNMWKKDLDHVLYSIPQNDNLKLHKDVEGIFSVLKYQFIPGSKEPTVVSVADYDSLILYLFYDLLSFFGGSYIILVPVCITIFKLKQTC